MSDRLQKLEDFFKEVAKLTVNHRVYVEGNPDDMYNDTRDFAWVSPKDLGEALEKIDAKWWENTHG